MIWMLIMNFKKYNNKAVNSYPVQLNQTFYRPHLKNMNVVSMYQLLPFFEELRLNCLTLNFFTVLRLIVEGEGQRVKGEAQKLRVRARSWGWGPEVEGQRKLRVRVRFSYWNWASVSKFFKIFKILKILASKKFNENIAKKYDEY